MTEQRTSMGRITIPFVVVALSMAAANYGFQAIDAALWDVAFERTWFQVIALAVAWNGVLLAIRAS
jgi:hypothetical protein